MKIERCLVSGARIYTKFCGQPKVVVDDCKTPAQALAEADALRHLSRVLHPEVAA